jgi:hypothetical protein
MTKTAFDEAKAPKETAATPLQQLQTTVEKALLEAKIFGADSRVVKTLGSALEQANILVAKETGVAKKIAARVPDNGLD